MDGFTSIYYLDNLKFAVENKKERNLIGLRLKKFVAILIWKKKNQR